LAADQGAAKRRNPGHRGAARDPLSRLANHVLFLRTRLAGRK
jgi:hypothetical protein